jgi:hypothetical protein
VPRRSGVGEQRRLRRSGVGEQRRHERDNKRKSVSLIANAKGHQRSLSVSIPPRCSWNEDSANSFPQMKTNIGCCKRSGDAMSFICRSGFLTYPR